MQARPFKEIQVRCLRCRGAGCPGCNNQGFKKRQLFQLEGVSYEVERSKEKEAVAQSPILVQNNEPTKKES